MSWEGLGHDPVPGDPDAVRAAAARLAAIGEQAELLHGRLRVLDGGSGPQVWRGEAADAFRDMLATIGPDLVRLASGHQSAERALRAYADALDGAQRQARQAEVNAEQAIAEKKAATTRAQQASSEASSHDATARAATLRIAEARVMQLASPDPVHQAQLQQYQQQQGAAQAGARSRADQARSAENTARSEASQAGGRLAAAKKLADQAASIRDDAARTAVRRLDDAGAPGVRHEWFGARAWHWAGDAIRHATADPRFLDWMKGLADVGSITMALGELMMIFPGLQGAGAVVIGLGLAMKGLAFVGTLAAAMNGKASAGQVVWRGVDVGLSVIPGMAAFRAAKAARSGKIVGNELGHQIKRSLNYSGRGGPSRHLPGITPGGQLGDRTERALRWYNGHAPDRLHISPKTFFQVKTGTKVGLKMGEPVVPITKPIQPDPVQRVVDAADSVLDLPERLVTSGVDRVVYGRDGFTPTH